MSRPSTPSARVNTGDFSRDASEARKEISRLPKAMQVIIRRLRFAYNQRQLLDVIHQEVDALAKAKSGSPFYLPATLIQPVTTRTNPKSH